jgi:queuine tRNA-ribosyltransferase
MRDFQFQIKSKLGNARTGLLTTPHGVVETPMFMPVGTQASVKSLSPEDLKICGAQMILGGNTYHMWLQPGLPVIKKAGGMHRFMGWSGPMLTDSGGFQVMSLVSKFDLAPSLSKINNSGVYFTSHLDGSRHLMTPEQSIKIQKILGADIIMAFDQCTADDQPKDRVKEALERTQLWLKTCKKAWAKNQYRSTTTGFYQALFGIIQGGVYRDLRRKAAEFVVSQNLPGVALGGETIGYNMEKTTEIVEWLRDLLPVEKPRYCMGLGRDPQDIITAIKMGIDLFDCVAPTRMARNGALYNGTLVIPAKAGIHTDNYSMDSWSKPGMTERKFHFQSEFPKGRLNIVNSRFKNDQQPIDEQCDCPACRGGFSRSYLRHLFKSRELLYYRLASLHNIRFMIRLCEQMRKIISHT